MKAIKERTLEEIENCYFKQKIGTFIALSFWIIFFILGIYFSIDDIIDFKVILFISYSFIFFVAMFGCAILREMFQNHYEIMKLLKKKNDI